MITDTNFLLENNVEQLSERSSKLRRNCSAVALAKVPVPEQTKTYKPISHAQLIDLTRESIKSAGLEIEQEVYSWARKGNQANGFYLLKSDSDNEIKTKIIWENSYDKTSPVKYAVGARVIICGNGMVSGDMGAFKRKHSGDVQTFTPTIVKEFIMTAGEIFKGLQQDRDKMKNTVITKQAAAALLGEMFVNQEILTPYQLLEVRRQLKNPTFDYGAPGTYWDFYNNITFATKNEHPSLYIDRHTKIHKFLMESVQ